MVALHFAESLGSAFCREFRVLCILQGISAEAGMAGKGILCVK